MWTPSTCLHSQYTEHGLISEPGSDVSIGASCDYSVTNQSLELHVTLGPNLMQMVGKVLVSR